MGGFVHLFMGKHYFFSHTTLKCLILYYKLSCTKLKFFRGVLSTRFSMYLLVWGFIMLYKEWRSGGELVANEVHKK